VFTYHLIIDNVDASDLFLVKSLKTEYALQVSPNGSNMVWGLHDPTVIDTSRGMARMQRARLHITKRTDLQPK